MSSQTQENPVTKQGTCNTMDYNNEVGMYFLIFFVILAVVWILLFSFNPYIVQKTVEQSPDGTDITIEKVADPVKCFSGAFLISLVIVIIVVIIKVCVK